MTGYVPDFSDLRGSVSDVERVSAAIVRAAAARLSILFVGPPGSGATMIARRLGGLLPDLTEAEALEVEAVWTAAGMPPSASLPSALPTALPPARPLRAPHHTVLAAGLLGRARPGEVHLAHRGVLFLDEAPEFRVGLIEDLLSVLGRPGSSTEWPTDVWLVGSAMPCACGWRDTKRCACSGASLDRWDRRLGRVSSRFGAVIELPSMARAAVTRDSVQWPTTSSMRASVLALREDVTVAVPNPNPGAPAPGPER